jgi:hypothetical protein
MRHFANFGMAGTVGKELLREYGTKLAPVGGAILGSMVGSRLSKNPEAEKAYDSLDSYYFNNEGRIPDDQLLKNITEKENALNAKYDNYRSKNNGRALAGAGIGAGVGLLGSLALSRKLGR